MNYQFCTDSLIIVVIYTIIIIILGSLSPSPPFIIPPNLSFLQIVPSMNTQKMAKYDKMICKFEYSRALDAVMLSFIANKCTSISVGVLQELIRWGESKGFSALVFPLFVSALLLGSSCYLYCPVYHSLHLSLFVLTTYQFCLQAMLTRYVEILHMRSWCTDHIATSFILPLPSVYLTFLSFNFFILVCSSTQARGHQDSSIRQGCEETHPPPQLPYQEHPTPSIQACPHGCG